MNRDTNHNQLPKEVESMAQNAIESERWSEIWQEAELDQSQEEIDVGRLQEIEDRLMEHSISHSNSAFKLVPRKLGRSKFWQLGMAAVFCVACLGSAMWFSNVDQRASNGETLLVELSDGSKVELNSGSSLRYSRFKSRKVFLDGEAFFDISHQEKPFIVETFNSEVEVLGTRFNIRAWNRPLDRQTVVSLESGAVRLSSSNTTVQSVLMKPGETRRIDSQANIISDSNASSMDEALAWHSGNFVYHDQFIGVILDDLERRFDVELQYDKSLRKEKMNIAIHQPESIERILNDLCGSLDLQYQAIHGGYELRNANANRSRRSGSTNIAP